jgi:hypothetical protein
VRGAILDIDEDPLVGAEVELNLGGRSASPVLTDSTGEYVIYDVPPGNHTIVVTHDDYREGDLDITVTGDIDEQKLILIDTESTGKYTIGGTITPSGGGDGLDGAAVRLKKNGIPIGTKIIANASGVYAIPAVPPGSYSIEASCDGYGTGTLNTVTVSSANLPGQDLALADTSAARTALQSAITAAEAARDAVKTTWTEGTEYAPGDVFTGTLYTALPPGLYYLAPAAVSAYTAAINTARSVLNNSASTADALGAAQTDLVAATAAFNAALTAKTEGALGLAARIASAASANKTVYLYANEEIEGHGGDQTITKTLTLKGVGAVRTVQLADGGGNMFYIYSSSAHLTLDENVTLRGVGDNDVSLVDVGGGGHFTMQGNARITGNNGGDGSAVHIEGAGSTFTMQGSAEISGNTAGDGGGGGGVFVADGGTFTMKGSAKVSDNNAGSGGGFGGGVFVDEGGTFIMEGGVVSGNTATGDGGGVFINNQNGSTFNKTGGTIYGSNGGDDKNTASSGQAVRAMGDKKRDLTANTDDNLYAKYNGTYPGGSWDYGSTTANWVDP